MSNGAILQHVGFMRKEMLFDGLVFEDGCVVFSVHIAESIEWSFRGLDGTMICWSFVRILRFRRTVVLQGEEVSEGRGTFFLIS